MFTRILMAAAGLLAMTPISYAGTTITGSYTAVPSGTGTLPTINYSKGYTYLPGSFTENLTAGTATAPTNFIDVAPGSGTGTLMGTIAVGFTLSDGSAVTSVSSTGNKATLVGGVIDVSATYELFYHNETDCITWSATSCSADNKTTTIGDTIDATFADGAVLAINLYNWSDWVMTPSISFDLLNGPTPVIPSSPVPEPASLALLGTALGGIGLIRRRRHDAKQAREMVSAT